MIMADSFIELEKISSPADLKKLDTGKLKILAQEIRTLLVRTIAKNGGHLAPNLGVVELTEALHYVYDSPKDKIVFDVSHQAYTHKLLTGRYREFCNIRKKGGISGYCKRTESEHDVFGAGHVGTAVSASLGIAEGRDLLGEDFEVVSVVGDGSLTNGLTFEGLNNVGELKPNVTVVLNDNKWSISKNIGGIAKYLERLSTIRFDEDPRTDIESIFNALGFKYFGPVDGHDLDELIKTFRKAKKTKGPKLVHVLTKKGFGYEHSENSPDRFHFTNPFVLESGKVEKDTKNLTYSNSFADALIKLAKKDQKIVAITAAMPAGTALEAFAKEFPNRFFDVGIAESHAVTFAGGLAVAGLKPVFAVYSSFLQRGYDQIIHDIALQSLPVVFAIDRAGIVGSDGPTHHGVFDLSYLRTIPNLKILAPKDENELQHMLSYAFALDAPVAIRYPRGIGVGVSLSKRLEKVGMAKAERLIRGEDGAILAIGSMVYPAVEVVKKLNEKKISLSLYNARSIKPIDKEMVKIAAKTGRIITLEENIGDGGFGSAVLEELEKLAIVNVKTKRIFIDGFIEHGEVSELHDCCGISKDKIAEKIENFINTK